MPLPLLRQGNIYIERASFSKTHGATPTQCNVSFEAVANVALGSDFGIDIGGSTWIGRVINNHVHKSAGVGKVTELTCNDVRELLQSQDVFCQLNQIDRKTGKIYTILDDDFVDALVALGYISQGTADDEYGKWEFLQQFETWDIIYPMTVINVLCYRAGFSAPIFSTKARNILNATASVLANTDIQGTLQATNNFFGIDWMLGEKCGSALAHIADLMGLQFTLVEGEHRLVFYQIGESAYGIEWQGVYAEETTQGQALQTQVDTGVWIMGERDVWELNKVDLVPSWNQAWNAYGLRGEQWVYEHILQPAGLDLFGTTIGDLKSNYTTISVRYFVGDGKSDVQVDYLMISELYDDGFTDSGRFADLSIHDYLERVFFKVYRIGIMDQLLSADEFNGKDADGNLVPVRFKPIHTPLISDPSVPYHVLGTTVYKKSKRHRMELSAPKTRMEKGHRLSDETGHVAFDTMQYTEDEVSLEYSAAYGGVPHPDLAAHIKPDAPAIDVCVYGPVYRKFFGMANSFMESGALVLPRIGNKKVPGLRHSKVIVDASRSDPADEDTTPWGRLNMTMAQYMAQQLDYLLDPDRELDADTQAMLVANALLNRPHVVTSGEEHFAGFCGHEPDGEIRRVSVAIDGTRGITETVSYSNDYPSLFHEPDIELLRRMGVDDALKAADRLKKEEQHARYKQQNEAEAQDEAKRLGIQVANEKRVSEPNHIEVGLAQTIDVLRGELVPLEQVDSGTSGGEFKTIASTDPTLVDGFKGAQGIALGHEAYHPTQNEDGHYGRLNVVTSGQTQALVMGPCNAGDPLCLAATAADKANWPTMGKYLKQGSGAGIVAMEDLDTPGEGDGPTMISVRVGGGSPEGSQRFLIDSDEGDYLVCYPFDGETVGDDPVNVAKPYLLRKTPFDGNTRNGVSYAYDISDPAKRVATKVSDSTTQTEVITPSYQVAEDEVWATKVDTGGTGVVDGDGNDVVWLEDDQGRAWAKQ